ncbi:MAG: amino acid adenylation domain-containing protein [Chloroflexi bacterium]|nr:amino acid adenylation domain-containing protein [Chloroflexota bacterium]
MTDRAKTIETAPALRTFPLSGRQHLILTENTLRPDLPINCEVMWMEVQGALDAPALQSAFRAICQRHEALRATLVEDPQGAMRLAIAPEPVRNVQIVEVAADEMTGWMAERCALPFGMDAPLFDAVVVKSAGGWILFMNMSHLITDGWSYYRLFADWSAAYTDALAMQGPEAAPGVSLRLMQDTAVRDATAQEAWEQVLNRADRPLFFGEDHARTGHVSRVTRDVPAALAEALHGRANGLPPSVTALVACAAAVHRTARPEQVSLAVPFLNRSQEERAIIGLMMQIVPTRVVAADTETFGMLAAQLKVYADRIRLIRHVAVPGHLANADVALNYYPPGIDGFAGQPATTVVTTATELVTAPSIAVAGPQVGMGLTIRLFSDAAGQLRRISFDFDIGAWPDTEDRARFAQAYMQLLNAATTDPDCRIGDVDVLRAGEAKELTFQTPSLGTETPAVTSILAQADRRPDAPAVSCGDVALNYGALAAQVRSFARGLMARGIGPGDLVAIGMERSTDLVVAMLGTMQVGAAYVPIDPHQPESRIAMIGEDAHCALSVVDALTGLLARALPRACGFADILTDGEMAAGDPVGPGALAYVIFTSGSTGRPKGVRVRQRGLSAFLAAMAQRPGLTKVDRVLSVTTVSFDIAALELFGPLVVGGAVRLASSEDALDGRRLASLMAQDGTTVFQATPATYKLLLTADWQAPGVTALCGGEALPRDLAEAILPRCAALWNMYGPTETTIWSSVERVEVGRAVRLGDPIAGTNLSVRTDTLALAPRGMPGELVIGGEGLAEGYHERPDLTAAQFPEDPLDRPKRLYRTGDGARIAKDGRLEFLGRLDFQVKVRGYRIELGEVETAVRASNGVSDGVVSTFADASGQAALVAYVVADGAFDEARTRAEVATALPAYMRPSVYVLLEALPLTPNGKVDRKALKASTATETPSAAAPDVAFADDLQRSLAAIFVRLLERSDVGPDAHFFDLGGNSLLAVNLVLEIEKATGTELSLGTVFSVPVLSDLAVSIREGGEALGQAATAVVPLQPEGDGAPSFVSAGSSSTALWRWPWGAVILFLASMSRKRAHCCVRRSRVGLAQCRSAGWLLPMPKRSNATRSPAPST